MDKWSCSKHPQNNSVKELCVRSKTGCSTLEECVSNCADKLPDINKKWKRLSPNSRPLDKQYRIFGQQSENKHNFEKKILEAINRLDRSERITSLPAELKSEILKNISSCTDLAQIRPILKLLFFKCVSSLLGYIRRNKRHVPSEGSARNLASKATSNRTYIWIPNLDCV